MITVPSTRRGPGGLQAMAFGLAALITTLDQAAESLTTSGSIPRWNSHPSYRCVWGSIQASRSACSRTQARRDAGRSAA